MPVKSLRIFAISLRKGHCVEGAREIRPYRLLLPNELWTGPSDDGDKAVLIVDQVDVDNCLGAECVFGVGGGVACLQL